MKKRKLFKTIGHIDDDIILEASNNKKQKSLLPVWLKWGAAAACILLAISFGVYHILPSNDGIVDDNSFTLSRSSSNIQVSYVNELPDMPQTEANLIWLTENELINQGNTSIFYGTVQSIKNIEIDFNGIKVYRTLSTIRVDKIYRGSCEQGDIISILLPVTITENAYVEDNSVIYAMREGMSGIFMPYQFDMVDEYSYQTTNGLTLYYLDIAQYGFLDGERYAFLETDNGLLFARTAYTSINTATSIEEIEQYIDEMIK